MLIEIKNVVDVLTDAVRHPLLIVNESPGALNYCSGPVDQSPHTNTIEYM